MADEMIDRTPVDKSGWGEGPWQREPDRLEWEHAGLPCLAVRHDTLGHWCGYAAVPPGHPLHGTKGDDLPAHGGITYQGLCDGLRVCHIAKPGEPGDVWWFGFDCAHAGDLSPGMQTMLFVNYRLSRREDRYRDLAYVQAEVNRLAEQLAEAHG